MSELNIFVCFLFHSHLHFSSNPSDPLVNNFWLNDNEVSNQRYKRDTWEEMAEKFNPKLDTKILVHGWKSSTQSNSIQSIRGAYMQRGHVNVFGKFFLLFYNVFFFILLKFAFT